MWGWGDGGIGFGGLGEVWLSLVKFGLGDCVWCVLLPKLVANATRIHKNYINSYLQYLRKYVEIAIFLNLIYL